MSSEVNELRGGPRRPQYLLSDDEIIANAWVFLLGGFETTANALTYCSYLLATHPEIQDKLQQEIVENIAQVHSTHKIIFLILYFKIEITNCYRTDPLKT